VKKHLIGNGGFHFRFWRTPLLQTPLYWPIYLYRPTVRPVLQGCRYISSMAAKELDVMTECSICTEVFTDPRVLPCNHSFCLKCLLNYGEDRQPGDSMPCPLCRKEFTIPDDGLSGTQRNFLVEKLLHARKLSVGEEASRVLCDIHKGEEIKVFCLECKLAICVRCFIKSHKTHDCSDIEEVSGGLRKQAESDADKATELLKKTGEVLVRFETERNDLINHLAGIEGDSSRQVDRCYSA